MAQTASIQTELDILSEKIETFTHLLNDGENESATVSGYLARKLDEYRRRYEKLTQDLDTPDTTADTEEDPLNE